MFNDKIKTSISADGEHVTLRELISSGGVPDSSEICNRLDVFRSLLSAVECIHSQKAVYGALVPENVLLDHDGHVELRNVCKTCSNSAALLNYACLGNIAFMSPEQAKGENVDCCSDIFALGVMLYQLMTNKMPWQIEGAMAPSIRASVLLGKIVSDEPLLPSSLNSSVSPELDIFILDLLHKKPEDRPQSISDVLQRFKDVVQCQESYCERAVCSSRNKQAVCSEIANDASCRKFGKVFRAAIAVVAVALMCLGLWESYNLGFWGDYFSSEVHPVIRAEHCQVGSYVKFGRYPQNDSKTIEPLEWQVLENDGKTALLISKYGLDCKFYNEDYKPVSWRDCDLRKWLNGPFFRKAFTRAERDQIKESNIYTGDNEVFNVQGCGETIDKIFCLSIEEAVKYFASDESRKRLSTKYAVSCGAFVYSNGCSWFWLRNPGSGESLAAVVSFGGSLLENGMDVNRSVCSIVPCLRINL